MPEDPSNRPTVIGLFNWSPPPGETPGLVNPRYPLPYRADWLPCVAPLDLRLISPPVGRLHRKSRDVLEHRTGRRLDLVARAIAPARRADAVLAFLEDQIPALSWMRRRGLPPYAALPAVGISCWWAEELKAGSISCAEVARHVLGLDRLLVFSENQQEIFARAGVDPAMIRPIRFGADHEYFTPGNEPERVDVLAVGIDRGRDWRTLIEAARRIPDVQVHIVTGPDRVPSNRPSSVIVHPPTDFESYRDLLRTARVVVVPSYDLAYPTGQSVLLEAMACGRCVVVTETEAMRDYIFHDHANLAVPPSDPEALADMLSAALRDDSRRRRVGAEARSAVERLFTFERMWSQIGTEILDVIERHGSPVYVPPQQGVN